MKNPSPKAAAGLALIVGLMAAVYAFAQSPAEKPSTENSSKQKANATNHKKKPTLAEVTRVSTAEAARSAASKTADESTGQNTKSESSDSAVLEFHPQSQDPAASSGDPFKSSKDSKDSALKNVHGTVYGSADAANVHNRKTGAAVGAGSKTGKSHIYVETDHARSSSQNP